MPGILWEKLTDEAQLVIQREPLLASYVHACILNHNNLESALSFILANKISDDVMPATTVRELFEHAFSTSTEIIQHAASDIRAVFERDAATTADQQQP